MKYVYLLTVIDNEPNECSNDRVFKAIYKDEELAFHYMLRDIIDQFEKGRIKNLDGLFNGMMYYKNGNIKWKIERILFVEGIK